MNDGTRIPRRVRFEVLRRDGHTCRYCGAKAPDVALTIDHVVPRVLGGSDDPTNLVSACADCNAGKSSVHPDDGTVADVDAHALRWAAALEEVARRRSATRSSVDPFLITWNTWHVGHDETDRVPLPDDWRASVARFVSLGLSLDDVIDFIGIAMGSRAAPDRAFAYLCGCCWHEIEDRQAEARALIDNREV